MIINYDYWMPNSDAYIYEPDGSLWDPDLDFMINAPERPPTRAEWEQRNPREAYRLPTLRELATGRSHNLWVLGDGLIGLMPFPI